MVLLVEVRSSSVMNELKFPIFSHWSELSTWGSLKISYPKVLGCPSTFVTTFFKKSASKVHASFPWPSFTEPSQKLLHHSFATGVPSLPPLFIGYSCELFSKSADGKPVPLFSSHEDVCH